MRITKCLKALANVKQRKILTLLRQGRKNAGELSAALKISAPALSYHLRLLKQAGLVLEYHEKNFIFYEVNLSVFNELLLWLNNFGGE